MEHYEEMERDVCEFKKYIKMTVDLMVDSYKWKKLAEYSEDGTTEEKYHRISDTLYNMFLEEHNHIGEIFKS